MIKVPLIESLLSSYQIARVVVLHVVHATCSVSPDLSKILLISEIYGLKLLSAYVHEGGDCF
jgi:hypothetical protein